MNKFIPFLANSILFTTGICGLIFHLPFVCAACFLAMSLLFIWCYYHIFCQKNNSLAVEAQEDISISTDMPLLEQAIKVQQLQDANNHLSLENQRLAQELEKCDETTPFQNSSFYSCILISALPVNLDTFFTTYITNHTDVLDKNRLHLAYHCAVPDAKTFLSVSALTVICNNILDNLIKFSTPDETVYCMLTDIEQDSLVIFKNTGEGLKETEIEHIFDINYQGANHKAGNGLGLAQVQTIIRDFGGKVWAKSTRNSGFALYLQIPAMQSPC